MKKLVSLMLTGFFVIGIIFVFIGIGKLFYVYIFEIYKGCNYFVHLLQGIFISFCAFFIFIFLYLLMLSLIYLYRNISNILNDCGVYFFKKKNKEIKGISEFEKRIRGIIFKIKYRKEKIIDFLFNRFNPEEMREEISRLTKMQKNCFANDPIQNKIKKLKQKLLKKEQRFLYSNAFFENIKMRELRDKEFDDTVLHLKKQSIKYENLLDLLSGVIKEWEKCSDSCDGIPKECNAYNEAKKILGEK